jgi:hypothetical protein
LWPPLYCVQTRLSFALWLCKRPRWYVRRLFFHCHISFVYSQALRTLWLIHFITCNFFPLDSVDVFCIALIRSKLELSCVAWH